MVKKIEELMLEYAINSNKLVEEAYPRDTNKELYNADQPLDAWHNNRPIEFVAEGEKECAGISNGKLVIKMRKPEQFELEGQVYNFNDKTLKAFRKSLGSFRSQNRFAEFTPANNHIKIALFKWCLMNPDNHTLEFFNFSKHQGLPEITKDFLAKQNSLGLEIASNAQQPQQPQPQPQPPQPQPPQPQPPQPQPPQPQPPQQPEQPQQPQQPPQQQQQQPQPQLKSGLSEFYNNHKTLCQCAVAAIALIAVVCVCRTEMCKKLFSQMLGSVSNSISR